MTERLALDLAIKAHRGGVSQAALCRVLEQTIEKLRPIALAEVSQRPLSGGERAQLALRKCEQARAAALEGRLADAVLLFDEARKVGGT